MVLGAASVKKKSAKGCNNGTTLIWLHAVKSEMKLDKISV